jgi:ferredoxin
LSIFDLLEEDSEQQKQKQKTKREELLESVGVKECFPEGSMKIDMRKCLGVECNLCVKACPTNALYWKAAKSQPSKTCAFTVAHVWQTVVWITVFK